LTFAVAYPDIVRCTDTLVLLAALDEPALHWLCADARASGLRYTVFHEPDLDDRLTAAAFEPAAHRMLSRLPLLLSRRREVKP
jgi:hypothetical protein